MRIVPRVNGCCPASSGDDSSSPTTVNVPDAVAVKYTVYSPLPLSTAETCTMQAIDQPAATRFQ